MAEQTWRPGAAPVHFELSGPADAPVVVLANSLGTTLHMWDPQMAALTARWRVVRYDQRGHGASPAPEGSYRIDDLGYDVLAMLDRIGLDRVSFCGVSLGGMVGMWVAAHAPERIDRLALVCTSAWMAPEGWTQRAATVRRDGTEALVDTLLARWFTADLRRGQPQIASRFGEMVKTTDDEAYAACCDALREMDLRPDLPRITAPTLVVAGAADPATPPADAEVIAAAIPGSRLEVVDGAAHLANVERPEQVTALIVDHLRPT